MKKTLTQFVKEAHEAGFNREEIDARAMREGYAKASVRSVISRFFVHQKRERRRAAGAGRHRLTLSPEEQKIFTDLESRHGDGTRQLLQKLIRHAVRTEFPLTLGEIEDDPTYPEGAKKKITIDAYERSGPARDACVKRYGAKCYVCGMRFEDKYGTIAKGFIHVHHLRVLATVGKAYKINPRTDLRPVCPNCHAVIHMGKPVPFTPEEVREMLTS